jgi:hypothetical protein
VMRFIALGECIELAKKRSFFRFQDRASGVASDCDTA